MRIQLGWVSLVGIGIVGAGCGTSTVPLDTVGDEFVQSVCEQIRRCPDQWRDEFSIINVFELQGSDISCEDVLSDFPDVSRAPSESEGVEGGTIDYDGAQARRCVRALAQSCVPFQLIGAVPECQGVFTGQVDVGDPCVATSECEPSAYCDLTDDCEGTCVARATVGQPCDSDEGCRGAEGTVAGCDDVDGSDVCVEYTITTDAEVGETCGPIDNEGSARTVALCGTGLYCRYVADAGSCALPIPAGQPCSDDEVCERGYFCNAGNCRTATFVGTVGDACDEESFIVCDPSLGLACDEDTDRCVLVGDGSEGSPCDANGNEFLSVFMCDDGLFCDLDAEVPTCKAPFANGISCESDSQCESGYCINDRCSAPVLCEEGPVLLPV